MKRGKKPCSISARTLFQIMDNGYSFEKVRELVESENESELNKILVSVNKTNSVTGKPGRPLSKKVLDFMEKNNFSVEKLYSLEAKERRSLIKRIRKTVNLNMELNSSK